MEKTTSLDVKPEDSLTTKYKVSSWTTFSLRLFRNETGKLPDLELRCTHLWIQQVVLTLLVLRLSRLLLR